jgi:hypothetical protein
MAGLIREFFRACFSPYVDKMLQFGALSEINYNGQLSEIITFILHHEGKYFSQLSPPYKQYRSNYLLSFLWGGQIIMTIIFSFSDYHR